MPPGQRGHRRWAVLPRSRQRVRVPAGGVRQADRCQPGGRVPPGPGQGQGGGRVLAAVQGDEPVRRGQAVRGGGEHGQAARLPGLGRGGQRGDAHLRRQRVRGRVRHRAQVPGDQVAGDRPGEQQPRAGLPWPARTGPPPLVLALGRQAALEPPVLALGRQAALEPPLAYRPRSSVARAWAVLAWGATPLEPPLACRPRSSVARAWAVLAWGATPLEPPVAYRPRSSVTGPGPRPVGWGPSWSPHRSGGHANGQAGGLGPTMSDMTDLPRAGSSMTAVLPLAADDA